jgi:hypothetical protein
VAKEEATRKKPSLTTLIEWLEPDQQVLASTVFGKQQDIIQNPGHAAQREILWYAGQQSLNFK